MSQDMPAHMYSFIEGKVDGLTEACTSLSASTKSLIEAVTANTESIKSIETILECLQADLVTLSQRSRP